MSSSWAPASSASRWRASCWRGSRTGRVTVLEREAVAGFHQTGHNSGVLHAGIYYAPGSLKARLSTEGSRELFDYCERRGLPARRDGKLIVAVSERSGRSSTSSSGAGPPTASRACGGSPRRRSPRSSRTCAASRRCTRRRPRSWTSRRSRAPSPTTSAPRAARSSPAARSSAVEPNGRGVRLRHAAGRVAGALRRLLRRRVVGPARGRRRRRGGPAHRPLPRRLAAPAPGAPRPRAGRSSTRCPTPASPSSASTSRAGPTTRCSSARPRCWPAPATPTRCAASAAPTSATP